MAHETLYRKFRSRTFKELVGQDHIVQTLENAIRHDRLGHAYIFSGPRGTGKTSTARILSKSLNCETGKTVSPCLSCDLCRKIAAGQSVDVIEIDAASNTGVDNIRELNDQINYVSVECRYKIYIVDEAHMLSTGAFNALLKTLEEPPKMTLFVLATTEPHKIPLTIHSRCQQLHFRRLKSVEISKQVSYVANQESISISPAAVNLVAKYAQGGMRDALSLLDQLYSFKGEGDEIQIGDVQMVLGATSFESLSQFATHFLKGEAEPAMQQIKSLLDEGCHVMQLCADLTELFRTVIYVQMGLAGELELDASRQADFEAMVALTDYDTLIWLLESLAKLEMELKWVPSPEALFQVKVLILAKKLADGPDVSSTETLQPKPLAKPQAAAPKKAALPPAPVSAELPKEKGVVVEPPTVNAKLPPEAEVLPKEAVVKEAPVVEPPTKETVPKPPINDGMSVVDKWEKVLASVRVEKKNIFPILMDSQVISWDGAKIVIKLKQDFQFFIEKLKNSDIQDYFRELTKTQFGSPLGIEVGSGDASPSNQADVQVASSGDTAGVQSNTATADAAVSSKTPASKEPTKRMNQIIEMFDAQVV